VTTPEQLRQLAQRYHELGAASDALVLELKAHDVAGGVLVSAELAALHAGRTAMALEERANHLELINQRNPPWGS
jgi:hypothetical protein